MTEQSEAKLMDSIVDNSPQIISHMHKPKMKSASSYDQIPKMKDVDEAREVDLISESEPDQEHPIAPEVSSTGGYIHSAPITGNPGKLFLGGLSYSTTQDDVSDHFSTFGKVVDVVVMKDKVTGKSRGFGFVTFEIGEIAEEIVGFAHIIKGRTIDVKRAVPRERSNSRNSGGIGKHSAVGDDVCENRTGGQKSIECTTEETSKQEENEPVPSDAPHDSSQTINKDDCKIFVGGLPPLASDTDLQRYFSKFGPVHHCAVMIDHDTLRSRGFGFVTYEHTESVLKVLEQPSHDVCGKWVEVKRAESREYMAKRSNKSLARQHNANWYAMSPEYNAPQQQQMYAPPALYGVSPAMYGEPYAVYSPYAMGYQMYGYQQVQYQPMGQAVPYSVEMYAPPNAEFDSEIKQKSEWQKEDQI